MYSDQKSFPFIGIGFLLLILALIFTMFVGYPIESSPARETALAGEASAQNTMLAARVAAESTKLAIDAANYVTSVSPQISQPTSPNTISSPSPSSNISTDVIIAIIGAFSAVVVAIIAAFAQIRSTQRKTPNSKKNDKQ